MISSLSSCMLIAALLRVLGLIRSRSQVLSVERWVVFAQGLIVAKAASHYKLVNTGSHSGDAAVWAALHHGSYGCPQLVLMKKKSDSPPLNEQAEVFSSCILFFPFLNFSEFF